MKCGVYCRPKLIEPNSPRTPHHGFALKDPVDVGAAGTRALIRQHTHFQTHERFGCTVNLFRYGKSHAAAAGTTARRHTHGVLIAGRVRLDIGIDLAADLHVGSHRSLRQAEYAGADSTRLYGRQQLVFHKKILSDFLCRPFDCDLRRSIRQLLFFSAQKL